VPEIGRLAMHGHHGKFRFGMESGPESGAKVISGGNFISGGAAPWYNKC
jgi:hypothetical protein